MDDLHQSDFREMRLKSQGDFKIVFNAVTGTDLDAYLRKFIVFGQGLAVPILWQPITYSYISHLRNFITLIQKTQTIFHLITPHILFQ